jgi:hypothetical protein
MKPWIGFKDGCVLPPRQVGSCAERVRSLMESGMDKVSFLKFIKRFGFYIHVGGLGDEWLPPAVLAAAFDTWETSRSLKPVDVYEQTRLFLGDVPSQTACSDDYLDFMQGVLDGESYWAAEEILTPYEIQRIEDRIAQYRQKNAEREALRRRRSKSQYALSLELRTRVHERDGHQCRACSSRDYLTIDHIVPLFSGGTDDFDNLQTLCRKCNSSKGRQEAAAWRRLAKKEGLS